MFQFYGTSCICELISKTRKMLIALNCCYSGYTLKTLNVYNVFHLFDKIVSGKSGINNPFEIIRTR